MDVALSPLDDEGVDAAVGAAVDGASPRDVMPPDAAPAPADWTPARVEAYTAFLRHRRDRVDETSYLVSVGGRAAGVARLHRIGAGELEAGLWLSRRTRGDGVGRRVLEMLLDHARGSGAATLTADTTDTNAAAVRMLRGVGAAMRVEGTGGDALVRARIDLRPAP